MPPLHPTVRPSFCPTPAWALPAPACSYPVLAALFRAFGAKRVMRFFPPVVTGPIVISIGLILASSAIANCQTNWLVAVIAVAVIIICNIWGRGMVKIVPILLGVVVSYAVAGCVG